MHMQEERGAFLVQNFLVSPAEQLVGGPGLFVSVPLHEEARNCWGYQAATEGYMTH